MSEGICGKQGKTPRGDSWTCALFAGHAGPHRGMSPEHGTVTRYRRFGCRCDDCRKASSARTAADRRNRPERLAKDVRMASARNRALTQLAHAHPDEYRALYEREMGR